MLNISLFFIIFTYIFEVKKNQFLFFCFLFFFFLVFSRLFILYFVIHILSYIFCHTYFVIHILSYIFCHTYFVIYILSYIFCHTYFCHTYFCHTFFFIYLSQVIPNPNRCPNCKRGRRCNR